MTTFKARWVLPMDGPPIEGGAVLVEGKTIAGVGRADEFPSADVRDLHDCILLPGLINAHTHLELGWCRGQISPRPLFDWFDELVRMNLAPGAEEKRREAIPEGARESIASGVTCVADISRTGMNAELLASTGIRAVCFVELISGARTSPNDAVSLKDRIGELTNARLSELIKLGISPHTPYSVTAEGLHGSAELARLLDLPMTLHLLETQDEVTWYAGAPGAVDGYLGRFNLANRRRSPIEPLTLLEQTGIMTRQPLLAHVNYVTDEQIARLAEAKASVAYCPRTHAYFQHAPHRWEDMLAAGVNVCIGTDSLASAPDLSILEEVRHLHKTAPRVSAKTLLEMATTRPAAALKMDNCIGSLAPGKQADMIAMRWDPRGQDNPFTNVVEGSGQVASVWVDGECVFAAK